MIVDDRAGGDAAGRHVTRWADRHLPRGDAPRRWCAGWSWSTSPRESPGTRPPTCTRSSRARRRSRPSPTSSTGPSSSIPTRSPESLRRGILHNAHRQPDGSWEWNYDRGLTDRSDGSERPGVPEEGVGVGDLPDLWDDVSDGARAHDPGARLAQPGRRRRRRRRAAPASARAPRCWSSTARGTASRATDRWSWRRSSPTDSLLGADPRLDEVREHRQGDRARAEHDVVERRQVEPVTERWPTLLLGAARSRAGRPCRTAPDPASPGSGRPRERSGRSAPACAR